MWKEKLLNSRNATDTFNEECEVEPTAGSLLFNPRDIEFYFLALFIETIWFHE